MTMPTTSSADPAPDPRDTVASEPLAPLPKKQGEPNFRDSWEAEAFAMGNVLVKSGRLDCKDWMQFMAEAIQQAQAGGDPDNGDTYYHHWCAALEAYCFEQGFVDPTTYSSLVEAWQLAIQRTPHGVPLALDNIKLYPDAHHEHHHHSHEHGHGGHHHHPRPDEAPANYWTPIAVIRPTAMTRPTDQASG